MSIINKLIYSMKINGDENEEIQFKKEIKSFITKLDKPSKKKLKKLANHHKNTFKHSMFVAHDTEYIARKLNYSEDEVHDLIIAAMLHDIGKLYIHTSILDLGDHFEMEEIYKEIYQTTIIPDKIIYKLKVKDVIKYNAHHQLNKSWFTYMRNYLKWLNEKSIKEYLNLSIREYLEYHQKGTEIILKKLGIKEEIIKLAAGHHPSYFSELEQTKLPKEAKIIEVADKFNAIIQSEGIRNYTTKKTKIEALKIITDSLENFYINNNYKSALWILANKYLSDEVKNTLIPDTIKLLNILRRKKDYQVDDITNIEKSISLIVIAITLNDKFKIDINNNYINDLRNIEDDLIEYLNKIKENIYIESVDNSNEEEKIA